MRHSSLHGSSGCVWRRMAFMHHCVVLLFSPLSELRVSHFCVLRALFPHMRAVSEAAERSVVRETASAAHAGPRRRVLEVQRIQWRGGESPDGAPHPRSVYTSVHPIKTRDACVPIERGPSGQQQQQE